ncbi:hypothetical protein [Streptomyces sp. NPDC055642]
MTRRLLVAVLAVVLGLTGLMTPATAAPGSYPPLVPGPDFLAWDGQSFTGHDEPAVAGEGDSRMLRLTPVPGTETVWSVGRADGPEGAFAPRILRFG